MNEKSMRMNKNRKFIFLILLYFFSLGVTALGQPDRFWGFCALSYLFGYSGLIYILLQNASKWKRFFLALVWGVCLQLFQNGWLATTHYHGPAILLVHLLVSLIIGLEFALLFLVLPTKNNLTISSAFLLASLWTLIEWSRLYYLCGYPFNPIGLVLTFDPVPMQLTSVAGIYGLTFYVMLVSSYIAFTVADLSWKKGSLMTLLVVFPFVFGFLHLTFHEEKSRLSKKLEVGLIQTGFAIEEKWEFAGLEERYIQPLDQWKKIISFLQSEKTRHLDFIVLPEVALTGEAFDFLYDYDEVKKELLSLFELTAPLIEPLATKNEEEKWLVSNAWIAQTLSNEFRTEIVIGLMDSEENKAQTFNSAFHFMPFKSSYVRYDKRALVPLTEYLPSEIFRSFMEKFGITTFFTRGKEAKIFEGKFPLSVSICFEEGFGYMIREGRLNGGEILVNISNDEWFPKSRLPKEHFNLGRIRAVENAAPCFRACNTGLSGAIDSLGRVVFVMPEFDDKGCLFSGIGIAQLSSYSYQSLYVLWGNGAILLLSLLCVLKRLFSFKPELDLKT